MIHQPKNNLFLRSRIPLFFILLLICSVSISFTQKEGYFRIFGNIRKDDKNLEGAEVKVTKKNVVVQTLTTTENGKFVFNLPLNGEYLMSVSKPGLLSKSIILRTKVPKKEKDLIFVYKVTIDLRPAESDSDKAVVNKPLGEIAYSKAYQVFDYKPLK